MKGRVLWHRDATLDSKSNFQVDGCQLEAAMPKLQVEVVSHKTILNNTGFGFNFKFTT